MALSFNDRVAGPYVCTGGETVLPYDFRILAAADLAVYRDRNGVITRLTLSTDYTVTGADNVLGGSAVLAVGALAGDRYVCEGARPVARTASLAQDRSFPAPVLDAEYDNLEAQVQELRRDVDRAVRSSAISNVNDAGGRRIVNAASGAAETDVATMGQIAGPAAAAAASASSALASETAAAASAAAAAESEDAAALSAIAAAADASAVNLRIYDSVAVAQGQNIPAAAAYTLIAEYEPTARLYKRYASDPGSGDRFQSLDGAWWKGLLVPPSGIDLAAEVTRTANVTFAVGDLNKAHMFTPGLGATLTCTLPPAASYVGSLLSLRVPRTSAGLLRILATAGQGSSVIIDWPTDSFYMWGGESILLLAKSDGWHLVDGVCRPLLLRATRTGADIDITGGDVEVTGFATDYGGTFWKNGVHALNGAGQIQLPRHGAYQIHFACVVTYSVAPNNAYATLDGNLATGNYEVETLGNRLLHAHWEQHAAAGQIVVARAHQAGGTGVKVWNTTMPARITVTEIPQW